MMFSPLLMIAVPAIAAAPLPPGDHFRSLTFAAEDRSYLVHIPPRYDASRPTPVVLALHSAVMNGAMMARFCGLSDKADRSGFVVVYPYGTGDAKPFLFWDAGGVRGRPSDDVGFIARVLDDVANVVNVDPRRVYATGMSNGAMMCYRLASELSHRIAAIAPVSGTMALATCRPTRAVPVLHFHGNKDPLVSFDGPNEGVAKTLMFKSVEETIRDWVKADGCPETPAVVEALDKAVDGTRVRKTVYGPGKDGAEVVLIVVEGGGHTWPGREPRFPLAGKSTSEISANDVMWDFFQKHPLR